MPLVSFLIAISANPPPTVAPPLTVPPARVRILPVRPVPGCVSSGQVRAVNERVAAAVAASGAFVPDDASEALLVPKLEADGGTCTFRVQFQDERLRLEGVRILPPGEGLEKGRRLEQAVDELAGSWMDRTSAQLEIASVPSGAQVLLDGRPAGTSPLVLHRLKPGTVRFEVRAPGCDPVSDSVILSAGERARRSTRLAPDRARRDSLRQDSLWSSARTNPAQALPDLFSRLVPADLPQGRHTLAVLPFRTESDKPLAVGWDPGVMAAEYGVERFSKDPRFLVVEREGLNRLLQEQALSQSGAAGDSVTVRAGRILAARYVVVGTVRVRGARQEFQARLVSVETGEVLSAAIASSASQDLEALYRRALGERAQLSGAIYRSAVGPGWGQFYTGHPLQGALALGSFLAAAGWTGWCFADYSDKDATLRKYRQNDPGTVRSGETSEQWLADAEAARRARNKAASRLGWSWAVLGGAWGLNLLDAGILGWAESREIKARYFAWTPEIDILPGGARMAWRF